MTIISKNSTTLLSINIVEVIDREYQRIRVEQNSFSCRTITVTETVTVNSMSDTGVVGVAYI